MDRIRRPLVAALFVLLALSLTSAAVAAMREKPNGWYKANLAGANEVPVVETDASGDVQFALNAETQTLEFRMTTRRLDGVTQAHIHYGSSAENGPVVAFLAGPASPPAIASQGKVAAGIITPEDVVGPLAGQWDAFVAALEAGDLYVNVHTIDYPSGEVRGQIAPGGPLSPPTSPPASQPASRPATANSSR